LAKPVLDYSKRETPPRRRSRYRTEISTFWHSSQFHHKKDTEESGLPHDTFLPACYIARGRQSLTSKDGNNNLACSDAVAKNNSGETRQMKNNSLKQMFVGLFTVLMIAGSVTAAAAANTKLVPSAGVPLIGRCGLRSLNGSYAMTVSATNLIPPSTTIQIAAVGVLSFDGEGRLT